jgi:predicted ATPase
VEALGSNGQLILDVIPEIELIVGPQPPVPELGPQESRNRFNFVLQNFVRVWPQATHPLVLFLDDLQWADAASLKLLQALLTDEQCHHLLVIGAYRDNEVLPSHPLMLLVDELRQSGAALNDITLGPLDTPHVEELLSDSLRVPPQMAEPLASLLIQRTGGNPFFLNQLLKSLHEERLLTLQNGEWHFDLDAIRGANLTDNVVELMAGKIQKLPIDTQRVLKVAACIGNRFDLSILVLALDKTAQEITEALWEALREGLIAPLSGNLSCYKFLHDRIQQAADSLMTNNERGQNHLKIARLMLKTSSPAQREERLFDIVNHWNQARTLVEDPNEIRQLVHLNLAAGLKAKASAAHAAALTHFAIGQELAPTDFWNEEYPTMFQLARERSECEYLEGHYERAEQLFQAALKRAKTPLDRASIERIRIQLYTTRGEYDAAVKVGLAGLRDLGIALPSKATQRHVLQELALAKWKMRGRKISDLQNAPRLTDTIQETALSLLSSLGAAAYLASEQTLFSVLVLKSVNITLRHGNSHDSAQAFAFYGLMLGSGLGDYQSGDEWGQLAIQLADATGSAGVKCVTYFLYPTYLSGWRHPLDQSEQFFWQAYRFGLESGDLVYSGYTIVSAVMQRATRGIPLNEQIATIEKYGGFLQWTKEANQLAITHLVRQACLNLQGKTASRSSLDGNGFEESKILATVWSDQNSGTGRCAYSITKSRLAYLWGDYPAALEMAREAQRLIMALLGQIWISEANFFYSLALAALYPRPHPRKRSAWKPSFARTRSKCASGPELSRELQAQVAAGFGGNSAH